MEAWRAVVGHEGAYEVSDRGRVRSLDRKIVRKNGFPLRLRGRLLRPGRTRSGHVTVAIGKGNSRLVHHLVLEAFVGPRPPSPFEGLHADDVGSNNHLSNLSWGTRSRNLHDAVRNGRKAVGENLRHAKLSNRQAAAVKALKGQARPAALGRHLGVAESTIRQIWRGRSWRSVAAITADEAIKVIYA